MVVLVTGDRRLKHRRKVWLELEKRKKKIQFLIEGGALGADRLAYEGAKLLGIQAITMEANWEKYGKAAGPIRNKKMLDVLLSLPAPRLVLAFHHDLSKSKGTANMVKIAKKAGVRVKVIKPNG